MGWTIGYMCDSSTCHQQSVSSLRSAAFPWCQCILETLFLLEAKWPQKFLSLLLHTPPAKRKKGILSSNSLKDWESIFSRSPSPESQSHFFWLNWVICSFLSQSQWLSELTPCWLTGRELFLIGFIPTLGDMSSSLRAPGLGKTEGQDTVVEEGNGKWQMVFIILYNL